MKARRFTGTAIGGLGLAIVTVAAWVGGALVALGDRVAGVVPCPTCGGAGRVKTRSGSGSSCCGDCMGDGRKVRS